MRGYSRLSHAYITDGETVSSLAMTAVCSGGNASDSGGVLGGKPCGQCIHCHKAIRQIHPDIIAIRRLEDKREILVGQTRELKKDCYIAPNEAAKKAYIIYEADTMNTSAQNALLQILEEPPPHVVIILQTTNPAALLPTVRSRCVEVRTQTSQDTDTDSDSDTDTETTKLATDFASALSDNMMLTRIMFRLEKLDRLSFMEFIIQTRKQLLQKLKKIVNQESNRLSAESIALKKKITLAEDTLIKAIEMLDLNINVGHISGMICATIIDEKRHDFD